MLTSRRWLAPLALLATLAAPAAVAEEPAVPRLAVVLRAGSSWPAFDQAAGQKPFRTAPTVELAVGFRIAPWLAAEVAGGWARSTPVAVSGAAPDPSNPSVMVPFRVQPELTVVPITGAVRLLWPRGLRLGAWLAEPALVVGAGAIYGRYRSLGTVASPDFEGWGPEAHVGLGVDLRLADGLVLGLEGRWRWAHATLTQLPSPTTSLPGARDLSADLGGASVVAAAGWSF